MPNGQKTYLDDNGNPIAAPQPQGKVYLDDNGNPTQSPQMAPGSFQTKPGGPILNAHNTGDVHTAIKQKYGLPESVDLTKDYWDQKSGINGLDPMKFSQAYGEANPPQPAPTGFLGRAWDEAKSIGRGLLSPPDTAFGTPLNPVQSAINTGKMVSQRAQEFKEHPAAASGATLTDLAAAAAPFVVDKFIGMRRDSLLPRSTRAY